MKKLEKLKLTQLSKNELEDRQMKGMLGGNCCACACAGSSGTTMNGLFNYKSDYGGSGSNGNCACICCGDENGDSNFTLGYN